MVDGDGGARLAVTSKDMVNDGSSVVLRERHKGNFIQGPPMADVFFVIGYTLGLGDMTVYIAWTI